MTFVSSETAQKYPEHTKAFVRAMLKASAFTQAEPYETARLQIENKHISGDLDQNAEMLKTYNYTPAVGLAYQTLFNAIDQVVDMGIMQNVSDKKAFVNSHFVRFDDVPDSYVYNSDGSYTETTVTKLSQNL